MSTTEMSLVDLDNEPFLSGRFAPVHDEISADHLVVEGTLPPDLTGAYLRNGPNPQFTPLGSYTYPLEGDGMVHGMWLEGGQARYANRWVRTGGFRAEAQAGRALFGGLTSPAFVDQGLLGDDDDPGWPFKLDPFINVVRLDGKLLALGEGVPPYAIGADLATVGREDFGGALPDGMCAHPKVDPRTGEMVVFRYDIQAPFLSWATIGPDGTVTQPPVAVDGVDEGYMIHDFAITERFVVLVVSPMLFDFSTMGSGGPPLAWKPEMGTRIAIIARDRRSPTRWATCPAMWSWHFANAYEDGERIMLDAPFTSGPALMMAPADRADVESGFARAIIDPAAGTVDLQRVGHIGCEFPRIDDRLTGVHHRYLTVASRTNDPRVAIEHDVILRYDMQAGTSTSYASGVSLGEVCFAPRDGGTDELDGYYLAYGTELDSDRSALYVWDAAAFPGPPIAKVSSPQRIPNGLHGNWLAAG